MRHIGEVKPGKGWVYDACKRTFVRDPNYRVYDACTKNWRKA